MGKLSRRALPVAQTRGLVRQALARTVVDSVGRRHVYTRQKTGAARAWYQLSEWALYAISSDDAMPVFLGDGSVDFVRGRAGLSHLHSGDVDRNTKTSLKPARIGCFRHSADAKWYLARIPACVVHQPRLVSSDRRRLA